MVLALLVGTDALPGLWSHQHLSPEDRLHLTEGSNRYRKHILLSTPGNLGEVLPNLCHTGPSSKHKQHFLPALGAFSGSPAQGSQKNPFPAVLCPPRADPKLTVESPWLCSICNNLLSYPDKS